MDGKNAADKLSPYAVAEKDPDTWAIRFVLFTNLYNHIYVDVAPPKNLGIRFKPPHNIPHPIGQILTGSIANDHSISNSRNQLQIPVGEHRLQASGFDEAHVRRENPWRSAPAPYSASLLDRPFNGPQKNACLIKLETTFHQQSCREAVSSRSIPNSR
jgi:hypothetical protein